MYVYICVLRRFHTSTFSQWYVYTVYVFIACLQLLDLLFEDLKSALALNHFQKISDPGEYVCRVHAGISLVS